MPTGQPYPDDLKATAVEVVREHGIAEATRRTGYPKSTLRMWAIAAGVDTAGLTSEVNRRSAGDAAERRRALIAEADERTVTLLTIVRDLALQKTVDRIKAGEMDDRSLIGAWTRATHDLALLNGQATERVEEIPAAVRVANLRDSMEAFLEGAAVAAELHRNGSGATPTG